MLHFARKTRCQLLQVIRAGGVGCLLTWAWAVASAADPYRTINQFYHRAWTAKDGAPADITSLAQTSDGFLWLGTASGLFRFDGIQFENYRLPRSQFPLRDNIYQLMGDDKGGLWVTYFFGGASYIREGRVTNYGEHEGLPASPIRSLAKDNNGSIWAATADKSLLRLAASHWQVIGNDWGFSGSPDSVSVDHAGTIWVMTPQKVFVLPGGSKVFQELKDRKALEVIEDDDGGAWTVRPNPNGSPRPIINGYLVGPEGGWWEMVSPGSVVHARAGMTGNSDKSGQQPRETFAKKEGLSGNRVIAMLRDREANVWIATDFGLDQFRLTPIVPVASSAGYSKFSLAPRLGGGMWAGAYYGPEGARGGGALLGLSAEAVTTKQIVRGIISAYSDSEGQLWLGTRGEGILRWTGQEMIKIPVDAPMAGRITKDAPGRLWASVRPGHWGLPGMRERAKRIGAHFEIWSTSGAGTEIEVRIPGALAYDKRVPRLAWLSKFRGIVE